MVPVCASYGLQATARDIQAEFFTLDDRASAQALQDWLEEFRTEPAKPTGSRRENLNPIVRERVRDGVHRRTIDLAWWKLWIGKEPARFPAINARVEGLVGSGAWGPPLKSRRALIPVTEYYEKGHAFRMPSGLFALAGLWNITQTAAESWMVSYAIVTRPAVATVAGIHDRMPLLIPHGLYDRWLDPERLGDQRLVDEMLAASESMGDALDVVSL